MPQIWELATTVGGLADGGILTLLDGTLFAVWKLRALGTKVGRGAVIFGGNRVETKALTIGAGAILGESVILQGHTVERLAATFLPTECAPALHSELASAPRNGSTPSTRFADTSAHAKRSSK